MFYLHSIAPLLEACKPQGTAVRCLQRHPPRWCPRHTPAFRSRQMAARLPREPSAPLERGVPHQTPDRTCMAASPPGTVEAGHAQHPSPLLLRQQRQNVCSQHPFDPLCSSKEKLSKLLTPIYGTALDLFAIWLQNAGSIELESPRAPVEHNRSQHRSPLAKVTSQ